MLVNRWRGWEAFACCSCLSLKDGLSFFAFVLGEDMEAPPAAPAPNEGVPAGPGAAGPDLAGRVRALEGSVDWLTAKVHRNEDRVDRLFAQARIFTINSQSLEAVWTTLGAGADAVGMVTAGSGERWLEEVTRALGIAWPLSDEQPARDAMCHGRRSREVMDALFAFKDEIRNGNLLRVEPEMGGEGWTTRKQRTFTLVFRLGQCADRLERHLSATLNSALATANRNGMGGQVQAWRATTRGEKRKRAQAKAAAAGNGDGAGAAGAGAAAAGAGGAGAAGAGAGAGGKGGKAGRGAGKGKGNKGKGGKGRKGKK